MLHLCLRNMAVSILHVQRQSMTTVSGIWLLVTEQPAVEICGLQLNCFNQLLASLIMPLAMPGCMILWRVVPTSAVVTPLLKGDPSRGFPLEGGASLSSVLRESVEPPTFNL
jgi:hypothetical protein